ncbi:MAG: TetR family transcriptional regulator [Edaphocola sp.]
MAKNRNIEKPLELNEKQRQIMAKALEVFSEKGFDSASVRDIAQRAEVNVAMISYYFGSKEKLLEMIFQNHIGFMRETISNIVYSNTLDSIGKLELIIDTYVDMIKENQAFHRLMTREQVLLEGGAVYNQIRSMKTKNRQIINIAIRAGQKGGIFQKNIDVDLMAVTFFGTVNYFFSNYKYLKQDNQQLNGPCGLSEVNNEALANKLKQHLKVMFKAYLTYGLS